MKILVPYRKIPKISPYMYKPLRIETPPNLKRKNTSYNKPLRIEAPGGLYLEIILSYTNQSKLHIITIIRKPFLIIKKRIRALKQCGQHVLKFTVFYAVRSSLALWIPSVWRQSFCKEVRTKIWNKFPSNYKPSQFWNANFPPIISPSEYSSFQK